MLRYALAVFQALYMFLLNLLVLRFACTKHSATLYFEQMKGA